MNIRGTLKIIAITIVMIAIIWTVEVLTTSEILGWVRLFSKVFLGLKLYWLILLILLHYHLREVNVRPKPSSRNHWDNVDEVWVVIAPEHAQNGALENDNHN